MSSVIKFLDALEENIRKSKSDKSVSDSNNENNSIMADENYIKKSFALLSDSLQKGYDIMQYANGDIHITETKIVTYKYRWDGEKNKFSRASTATRNINKVEETVENTEKNDSSHKKIA